MTAAKTILLGKYTKAVASTESMSPRRTEGVEAPKYQGYGSQLNAQLEGWLSQAQTTKRPARAIIAPRRVFILGPSHHVPLSRCALSPAEVYRTPLYDLRIDQKVYADLWKTGMFERMTLQTDEEEHSIEMQLPYTAKAMESHKDDFAIVPILVGALNESKEQDYGKLLSKYLADPSNLFVISSDFCHWGQRFRYTYYDETQGEIYRSIEHLDKMDTLLDIPDAQAPRKCSSSTQARRVKLSRQARDIMDFQAQMAQVLELLAKQAPAAPATIPASLQPQLPYSPSARGIQLVQEDTLSIAVSDMQVGGELGTDGTRCSLPAGPLHASGRTMLVLLQDTGNGSSPSRVPGLHGGVDSTIEALVKASPGMSIIEQLDPISFSNYLKKYRNTICGRHPIGVLLNAVEELKKNGIDMNCSFLNYAQSSQCRNWQDSSVSYAAGALIVH
ncbi:UNVERIFIED_CONTAM: hypothetical protein FKN15_036779 [Acipenser sinensis]